MRNILFNVVVIALLTASLAAQKSEATPPVPLPPQTPMLSAADLAAKVPAPKPEDVKSLDAILAAIYDVISGPAGDRDWNRFRSLFLPQSRFTQTSPAPDGKSTVVISWNEEEFIHDASDLFTKEAFYENAIVNEPDVYGNMAQVFSSYESRHKAGEKPFQRGINSIQLLNDGKRWWVLSILWDAERPDNPLPAKFAKK
ncbi:MAG TPA: hypothetical protein VI386_10180 [Candidatus Sulfotelmatobacter sp.]